MPQGKAHPLAYVSESGAFLISRLSRRPWLEPLYAISMGGQADLRLSDYLRFLRDEPEVRVVVDRQEAWRMGLSTQLIGLTVQAAINGRKAADFREGDEEYDVTVRFPKAFRENLANINTMNLISIDGRRVPFSSVARIEQGAGLGSIKRIDRNRTVTVSAGQVCT